MTDHSELVDEREQRARALFEKSMGQKLIAWSDETRFYWLGRADADAEQQAEIARRGRVVIDVAASLAAAISLLERGGKAAKKAAPSDRMFDQMLADYRASLDRARAALGSTDAGELK